MPPMGGIPRERCWHHLSHLSALGCLEVGKRALICLAAGYLSATPVKCARLCLFLASQGATMCPQFPSRSVLS